MAQDRGAIEFIEDEGEQQIDNNINTVFENEKRNSYQPLYQTN